MARLSLVCIAARQDICRRHADIVVSIPDNDKVLFCYTGEVQSTYIFIHAARHSEIHCRGDYIAQSTCNATKELGTSVLDFPLSIKIYIGRQK